MRYTIRSNTKFDRAGRSLAGTRSGHVNDSDGILEPHRPNDTMPSGSNVPSGVRFASEWIMVWLDA